MEWAAVSQVRSASSPPPPSWPGAPVVVAAEVAGAGRFPVSRPIPTRRRLCLVDAASLRRARPAPDRKSVVAGKSVSVRVDLGGRRIIKKKTHRYQYGIMINDQQKESSN